MRFIKDLGLRETGKLRSDTGNPERKRIYQVECETCNNIQEMRMSDFKRKPESECKSCAAVRRATKHGVRNTRLYSIYTGMKHRCYSENSKAYKYYGGRGICICDEWLNDIMVFVKWAEANGYKEHFTIDRKDNDGNYEPSNCRWTTQKVQSRNNSKLRSTNTSGYRGVIKKGNRYVARITVDYSRKHLGYFNTPLKAAKAYDRHVIDNNLEHTVNGVLDGK